MQYDATDRAAKIIWDYMHMHHELKKADCILVMGSYDVRVAHYGVDLYKKGYAPIIIFSGGGTRHESKIRFGKSEAEAFADIARARGVPEEDMVVEDRASNTAENIEFSKQLLKERRLDPQLIIVVQKPNMERRAYATFRQWWPEKDFIVTSPPLSYEEYSNEDISKDLMINNMVGDFQRVKVYAEKGWQIPQEIPREVWAAYEELVARGYSQYLVKEG